MSLRLFIGIELAPHVRGELAAAIEALRAREVIVPPLRVLAPDSWHITLQFLGSVAEAQLEPLTAACSAALAAQHGFELELSAAGAFPNARRARVVWLGTQRGGEQVAQLARAVQSATAPLGFAPEERALHPHATWARAKPFADARALLNAFAMAPSVMRVGEVALFRSHLSSSGARYEALARMPLE